MKRMLKRILVGGILLLCGTLGFGAMVIAACMELVGQWVTPPGRVICTILSNGTVLPSLLFFIMLLIGVWILWDEYTNKD